MCDKSSSVSCDRLVVFSMDSSTNKTVRHDITEIFLKVALNTIHQTKPLLRTTFCFVRCLFTNGTISLGPRCRHGVFIYLPGFDGGYPKGYCARLPNSYFINFWKVITTCICFPLLTWLMYVNIYFSVINNLSI